MDSQPSVQGGLEGMVLSSPEFRFDKGGMAKPPCGTPMSQASTVPNTPMMGWTLPDPAHFSFSRQHSMDSCVSSGEMFLPPWQRVESLHEDEEDLVDEDGMRWEVTRGMGIPTKTSLTEEEAEHKAALLGGRFQTLSRAHHGMLWRQYRPRPAPEMTSLEKQLAEVKALFQQETGQDVDDEDESDLVDDDGMQWVVTRGTGIPAKTSETEEVVEHKAAPSGGRFQTLSRSHHKVLERQYLQLPAPEMSSLEKQLAEVKALFKQKTGQDVNDEDEDDDLVDEDGTQWMKTAATGQRSAGGKFQTLSRSHHKALEREYLELPAPAMSSLEKQLAEVKALFKQKTGQDVDDKDEADDLVDEDGMRWTVTRGTGVPAKCSKTEEEVEQKSAPAGGHFQTLSCSHHKALERQYLQLPAPEMSDLWKQLSEVKALFYQKTGQDVDDDSEDLVDEDGMRWEVTRGTGQRNAGGRFQTLSCSHHKALERQYLQLPAPEMTSLEKQLAEVKALFKQKTGEDVDDEDEVDEDGTQWMKTAATGQRSAGGKFQTLSRSHHKALEREYLQLPAPEMSSLERQLSEVKALFKQKTGQDVDDEDEADDLVDEDGMRWTVTRGTGVPAKCSKTEEEVEQKSAPAGGHFQTLSCSHHKALERQYLQLPAPEMSDLWKQLSEVKALFYQKTGQDVDDDSEDLVDEDGMRWEVTRGTGQRSAGGRFQTLSRSHHKALERQYLQLPAPAMSSLEKQLSEVKALFKQKTGEDVDDEDEENLVDEDGIRWVVTRGTHVPMKLSVTEEVVEHKSAPSGGRFQTLSRSHHKMLERQYRPRPVPEVSALEAQLSEVKALFKQKTGQDVDEVERGCVLTFLAGWRKILFGTPTRRRAPEMSCLEAQLEEVKALFKQKYGRDVDDLDESDLIDEDGMRWNVTRGTGVPSKCSMTEEEVEQKAALSGGRFQTLKRSHHKKLAWEYALQSQDMVDEDGMVWVKTVGNGVPAKTSATEEEVEQRPTSSGGKFQTFSRRHQKRLERRYNAQAPPELAAMEATLAELKELFQQKTGHDVDED